MGIDELQRALSSHQVVLLDTMVFSYYLANHPRYVDLAGAVLDAIETGQVAGLTTTVTVAKVLTVPAQAGDPNALLDYELYLTHFPNLEIMPLDMDVARETARVRAATGLRTPDAVQVAAAQLAGADAIVTNDRRWQGRFREPALLMLDMYVD